MEETKKFTCGLCHHERPDDEHNVEGHCIYCLADHGNPAATQLVLQEILENHGYRGIDSVLVGGRVEDGPPHVPSTQEACNQCKEMAWMSVVSKAMVIKQAEKDGGKHYFLCMNCIPDSLAKEPIIVPDEQKAEMLAAGFDIDKLAAEKGINLQEMGEHAVRHAKNTIRIRKLIRDILQRAAKRKEEGGPETRRRME